MAESIIQPTEEEATSLVRSYVDYSKLLVQNGYTSLGEYSPQTVSLLESSMGRIQDWTPDGVKLRLQETVEGLEDYVDYTDDFLTNTLERTQEFPHMFQNIREQLSKEEILKLVDQVRNSAGAQISEFLPSQQVQDLALRAQIQELVAKIMSQPDILKGKVGEIAAKVDLDHDGKISLSDLTGNALQIIQGSREATEFALGYCSNIAVRIIPTTATEGVKNLVSTVMENETTQNVLETVKTQWSGVEETLLPLWNGAEVLKVFVSRATTSANAYASNVSIQFTALTPYLTKLVKETSVFELPWELLRLSQTVIGLDQGEDRVEAIQQSKALFFTLIDISVLIQALKSTPSTVNAMPEPAAPATAMTGVAVGPMQNIQTIDDSEALKDTSWLNSYANLECS